MRRWNGWGDDTTSHDVNPGAQAFLEARLGTATPPKDATLEQAIGALPPSRVNGPLCAFARSRRTSPARRLSNSLTIVGCISPCTPSSGS